MATIEVEVSTWAGLVSALTQIRGETILTVKLTKDIDCNDEIPEGVSSTIEVKNTLSYMTRITIDGSYVEDNVTKNHVIRNLRTHVSSPKTIFKVTNYGSYKPTMCFKNIDFINLILEGNGSVYFLQTGNDTDTDGYYNTFDHCRFVGRRSRAYLYALSDAPYATSYDSLRLISCFINMPYIDKTPSADYQKLCKRTSAAITHRADYCYFVDTYTGWTPAADDELLYNFNLNGCYITGEMVTDSTRANITVTNKYSFNASIQNVIDCKLLCKGEPSGNISVYAPEGIWKDEIVPFENPESGTTYSYTNQNASAIPCTPAEMVDAQALYDKGFDIVVPNT